MPFSSFAGAVGWMAGAGAGSSFAGTVGWMMGIVGAVGWGAWAAIGWVVASTSEGFSIFSRMEISTPSPKYRARVVLGSMSG